MQCCVVETNSNQVCSIWVESDQTDILVSYELSGFHQTMFWLDYYLIIYSSLRFNVSLVYSEDLEEVVIFF